jgi:hypothetical protein
MDNKTFYYLDDNGKTQKIVVDKRTSTTVHVNGEIFSLNSGEFRVDTDNSAWASVLSPLMKLLREGVLPDIGRLNVLTQSEDGLSVEIATPFIFPNGTRVVATVTRDESGDKPVHALVIGDYRRTARISDMAQVFFDTIGAYLRDRPYWVLDREQLKNHIENCPVCKGECQQGLGNK